MELCFYINEYYEGKQKNFAAQQVTSKGTPLTQQQISKWNKMFPEVVIRDGNIELRLAVESRTTNKPAITKFRYRRLLPPKEPIKNDDLPFLSEVNCPPVVKPSVEHITHQIVYESKETTLDDFIRNNYGTQRNFADNQKTRLNTRMTPTYVSKMKKRSAVVVEIEGEYYIKTFNLRKITAPPIKK